MSSSLSEPASENATGLCQSDNSEALQNQLVQVFKLLSDETRLKVILHLVREGELHVSALCERLKQSQPAVSHHLGLLREAGVLEFRRDGKHNFYSVRREHFHQLVGELFSRIFETSPPNQPPASVA